MWTKHVVMLALAAASAACSPPSLGQARLRSASTPASNGTFGELSEWVDLREFRVPTPDAFPHDPAAAPDGSLWVTEQNANKLGRLDPRTGAFREVPLVTPGSGPHGLTVDSAGTVWFTANRKAYIGRLSPSSGEVKEYPIPDPRATDPHTPVLGPHGTLWFTVEQSNFVGRLDPESGRIDLVPVPTPSALPYGMALGPDGAPYFCEFGANRIGRVDPSTLTIREYRLAEGARPRRLALAPDGTLYYSDYARGMLGRLNPRTGHVDEWSSPAGASSHPYGIAITSDGLVWYSESGPTPNTLVRFDPGTAGFAVMSIPSGGGVVRNMAATRDRRIFMAESGVDRVAVVSPRHPGSR
jgi:virginiamycin B lyase